MAAEFTEARGTSSERQDVGMTQSDGCRRNHAQIAIRHEDVIGVGSRIQTAIKKGAGLFCAMHFPPVRAAQLSCGDAYPSISLPVRGIVALPVTRLEERRFKGDTPLPSQSAGYKRFPSVESN